MLLSAPSRMRMRKQKETKLIVADLIITAADMVTRKGMIIMIREAIMDMNIMNVMMYIMVLIIPVKGVMLIVKTATIIGTHMVMITTRIGWSKRLSVTTWKQVVYNLKPNKTLKLQLRITPWTVNYVLGTNP